MAKSKDKIARAMIAKSNTEVNTLKADNANIKYGKYNILDYGAIPSDSTISATFDNSTAIKDAIIDAMNNGGGDVIAPSGIYKCNIVIDKNEIENCPQYFNVRLIGTKETIFYNTSGTIFTLKGIAGTDLISRDDIGYFDIENIKFLGKQFNHVKAIDMQYTWKCNIIHCSSEFCSDGVLHFTDVFDSEILGFTAFECDYDYMIKLMHGVDNTNAIHFTDCHFEKAGRFLYVDNYCRHIYFTSCKFEKAKENTDVTNRPMLFYDCREVNFSNCMFANNKQTVSTDPYILDNELPFLKTYFTPTEQNMNIQPQSIKFSACDFASAPTGSCVWFIGDNTKFKMCTFYSCGSTNIEAFYFNNNNDMSDCNIYLNYDRFIYINGTHNNVLDIKINYLNAPTVATFKLGTNANYNMITYETLNNDLSSNYISAGGFEWNDVLYLKSNKIINKHFNLATENSITPIARQGTSTVQVTSASMTYINNISCGYNSQIVTLINKTGGNLTVNYNANKIVTKSLANITISNTASVSFRNSNGIWYEM